MNYQPEGLEDLKRNLAQSDKGLVDAIVWNHSPFTEESRLAYVNQLFDMASAGQPISSEDVSRLILNCMVLLRDNTILRKKLDSMVIECLKSSVNRVSFRC